MGVEGAILVTGATGSVGGHVVAALRQRGAPVVAAVRDVERGRASLGTDVPCVRFDFTEPATFAPALAGVRGLFLVRPPDIADVKRLIAPVIDAAQRAGVEQVVFLSVLGAEQIKVVPHYKIEQVLEKSGMAWTFLRPSFFLQNMSAVHRADIRDRDEIFVPAGQGWTSFIDDRDVAAIGALALTEPGHAHMAYPLTGPVALSYGQLAAIFTEVLSRPIRYADPSILAFARRMRAVGHPWMYILTMIGIYTTARVGRAATVTPDLPRLLGRDAITPRQFVADYRDCWTP